MVKELAEPFLIQSHPLASIEEYEQIGGGEALRQAAQMPPEAVIQELRRARLRGRGGAGFLTATKWSSALSSETGQRFIVANGAEGEPGTFKDRQLMRMNPYSVIEGILVAEEVVGAEAAYIGIKERFRQEIDCVQRAIDEFARETPLAETITIVPGPDEYLFGEESALLEVIGGGLPMPHVFPPYIHGLFAGPYGGPIYNPTIVNNVETYGHVPGIIANGSEWFRSVGAQDTPGTTILTLSGDVEHPAVREVPTGLTIREAIDSIGGGVREGRAVKAVFSGLANVVIRPDQLDTALTFDEMRNAGLSLGSSGLIVYDETRCMAAVAHQYSRFLHIESCGQCTSCKLGSRTITDDLERLLEGVGTGEDLREIARTTEWVENRHRCFLPTSESLVISSMLDAFPEDFHRHLRGDQCHLDHDIVLPKMIDYREGEGFVYDRHYEMKRPDWSYEPEPWE